MGKPRMIILVRHAQSEGNKNREIHQTTPDHRVKLTPEGWSQSLAAGHRLRTLLHPTDTLHFFTSPYRRTRETTEGILQTLTAPSPPSASEYGEGSEPIYSPFPRHTIKVYEEPRLREQDFGNFQPSSAEMSAMWRQRAEYGHFFYRIPNGESAADAYDRVSGFNESLWRSFGEADFASVAVLVTHGLMARVFLMKWYHFSVEYFEDLRNVEHCEFVVMKLNAGTGKYVLQNQLRTWSGLKREKERERREVEGRGGGLVTPTSPDIPVRKKWAGCHDEGEEWRRRQRRQNTADLFMDEQFEERVNEAMRRGKVPQSPIGIASESVTEAGSDTDGVNVRDMQDADHPHHHILSVGRDFGGSRSGAASPGNLGPNVLHEGRKERSELPKVQSSMSLALNGDLRGGGDHRVRADALGDQSEEEEDDDDAPDTVDEMKAAEMSVDASVR